MTFKKRFNHLWVTIRSDKWIFWMYVRVILFFTGWYFLLIIFHTITFYDAFAAFLVFILEPNQAISWLCSSRTSSCCFRITSSSVLSHLGFGFFSMPLGLLGSCLVLLQTLSLKNTWQLDECNNTEIFSASSVALIMAASNSESMANSLTSAYNQVNNQIGEM